jgi:hypothetical protein
MMSGLVPSHLSPHRGKTTTAPPAKPVAGTALAASFRRFPAANLHQRLTASAKR